MRRQMSLAPLAFFASALPVLANSMPIDVVKGVYAMPSFEWTQFATQTPAAFSTQFISTWRAAMKFKDCNFYDGDILTGEGDGGGVRRLNSATQTLQSENQAEVTANVSPDAQYDQSINIRFELINDRGIWRIDDIIMPSAGNKTPDGKILPVSIKNYLGLVIRTKCSQWKN
jgi:hypothetical protein